MTEKLRNYAEAAEWLGVSSKWLEAQVQAGNVSCVKLGKLVKFTQAHLDELVAAHEVPARNRSTVAVPLNAVDLRPAPRRRRAVG
jgi:excisionase family DNA binding protein